MRKLLLECYRIEQLAAKIYTQFANKVYYPTNVRETFRKMAKEELEHARIIDLVLQTPTHELDAIPWLSEKQVDEKLQFANALLASAAQKELSASDAVKLAIEAEEQLVEVHANQALIPGAPKLAAFFNDLSRYDAAHVDRLRACLD
jgi:rubrerythrin